MAAPANIKPDLKLVKPKKVSKRKQWELDRVGPNGYIGASEAAACLGIHPYMTPHDLWLVKTGRATEEDIANKFAVSMGNHCESWIAKRFCFEQGISTRKLIKGTTVRHPRLAFMGATPDYELNGEDTILECKLVLGFSSANFGPDGSDEVPRHYFVQCCWQLFLTGKSACILVAALCNENKLKLYRVERKNVLDVINATAKAVDQFWNEYVLKDTPPPLTGHESDTKFLRKAYNYEDGSMTNTDPEHDALAIELLETDLPALDRLELEIQRKKNLLMQYMGEAAVLDVTSKPGLEFTWKADKNGKRSFRTPHRGQKA